MDVPGVAVITGAASGIARATAMTFARDGATGLALLDLDAVALGEVKHEIEQQSFARAKAPGNQQQPACRVETFVTDISNEQKAIDTVLKIALTFGRIDYLVNAAGIAMKHPGGAAFVETRDWQRIIDINLTGTFFMQREVAKVMLKQSTISSSIDGRPLQRGSIVNIASIQGLVGIPLSTAYAVTKHGVIGLTKTASEDYAKDGLRINAICPGYTETPLTTKDPKILEAMQERVASAVPMGRMAKPEEIADGIVWLSGGRSSFVTGTSLVVDGGFTQR